MRLLGKTTPVDQLIEASQRIELRLRNGERLQAIMGADALEQNLSVHEVIDFEYAVRTGPGQLHGGGTLDTDRLIFARRLGLGRPSKETAPETH